MNSNRGGLKYVHSLSGPDIQIITGAELAINRKRSSLSRSSCSVFLLLARCQRSAKMANDCAEITKMPARM